MSLLARVDRYVRIDTVALKLRAEQKWIDGDFNLDGYVENGSGGLEEAQENKMESARMYNVMFAPINTV